MKRLGLMLPLALLLTSALLALDFGQAQAHTCNSVCNQVRRACRRIARTTKSAAVGVCLDTRDTCRAACNANAATCTDTCYAGDPALLDQCLADCAQCKPLCNADNVTCRATARTDQQTANVGCDGMRDSCSQVCTDPIASTCVRPCTVTRRECDHSARTNAKTCKKQCANGTGRRACVRGCREQLNGDLGNCSDVEITCLAGCAGYTP